MTNILVVLDPEETQQLALDRVREIAPENIKVKVDYYFKTPELLAEKASSKNFALESKHLWLEEQVKPLRSLGYQIETSVINFERLYETIIQSAQNFEADYIFKPLRQHGAIRRTLFTSTDWNLVRLSTVPLLLVSGSPSLRKAPVLAAVNSYSKDTAHQELNDIVLTQAKRLAGIIDSEVHLVTAYDFGAVIPSGMGIGDPLAQDIIRNRRVEQRTKAFDFAASKSISKENTHVDEGNADSVVTDCAERIDASVIVLGTVARSGISGMFIGNTAESVMEHTHCDVFVVKQEGFESPVKAA